jgi:hypothetical protein
VVSDEDTNPDTDLVAELNKMAISAEWRLIQSGKIRFFHFFIKSCLLFQKQSYISNI